jgi:hypothetical protein
VINKPYQGIGGSPLGSGSENSLTTRRDVQDAVRSLARPVAAFASPAGARVRLGATGAYFPAVSAELEGFARPLWGLAPLAAGGCDSGDWERLRQGLAHGTDPAHPEFWGLPADYDQRLVETAPIAVALCLVPAILWDPLAPAVQANVVSYLGAINRRRVFDNNWLFFRVLVNLALARVGARPDRSSMASDLDRLESFDLGDGWYSDGPTDQRDYYVAFAMHFYGLLFAAMSQGHDRERCARFRERAARFAQDFMHWFGADGSSVPYGRSLTYRFAQGAFWGALAFAGVEALSWGVIKGLALRHLRWWLRQPIFTEAGLLSVGYAYPNLNMAEGYNAPGSPYWAFKAFLPLALPDSHPFWMAREEPLPDLPPVVHQQHPRLILCRDSEADHVVALSGGQWASWQPRHVAEKYAKFCYSTRFGFSVPSATTGLAEGAHDSMLALSEEGDYFRVRRQAACLEISDRAILSEWQPWPDVSIRTWLVPAGLWHVRVHRIRSGRRLQSAEGGFALDCSDDGRVADEQAWRCNGRMARAEYPAGVSLICDLVGGRRGRVVRAAPNTNLLYPRTVIPTLIGSHQPGEYWLACAALGRPEVAHFVAGPEQAPTCTLTRGGFAVTDSSGGALYRC